MLSFCYSINIYGAVWTKALGNVIPLRSLQSLHINKIPTQLKSFGNSLLSDKLNVKRPVQIKDPMHQGPHAGGLGRLGRGGILHGTLLESAG